MTPNANGDPNQGYRLPEGRYVPPGGLQGHDEPAEAPPPLDANGDGEVAYVQPTATPVRPVGRASRMAQVRAEREMREALQARKSWAVVRLVFALVMFAILAASGGVALLQSCGR